LLFVWNGMSKEGSPGSWMQAWVRYLGFVGGARRDGWLRQWLV